MSNVDDRKMHKAIIAAGIAYEGDLQYGFIKGWDAQQARIDELTEQIRWTVNRCNEAMGDGFSGTPNSSVAAVCDALIAARAKHYPVVRGAEEEVAPEATERPVRNPFNDRETAIEQGFCGRIIAMDGSTWCLQTQGHKGACKLA